MGARPGFVLDASVLIDYAVTDLSVLELVARHVAPVHVPTPLLQETQQVSRRDCEHLGIIVSEPTLEQLLSAGQQRGGPLSFQDRMCVIASKAGGLTCVTNDRALRRACVAENIDVVWGLELIVELVERQQLTASEAIQTARAIAGKNRFITSAVISRFTARVGRLGRRR